MNLTQLELLSALRADTAAGRAREIRRGAGVSQSELAEAIGIARPTLAAWENGSRTPTGRAALRYAAALSRLRAVSA